MRATSAINAAFAVPTSGFRTVASTASRTPMPPGAGSVTMPTSHEPTAPTMVPNTLSPGPNARAVSQVETPTNDQTGRQPTTKRNSCVADNASEPTFTLLSSNRRRRSEEPRLNSSH